MVQSLRPLIIKGLNDLLVESVQVDNLCLPWEIFHVFFPGDETGNGSEINDR